MFNKLITLSAALLLSQSALASLYIEKGQVIKEKKGFAVYDELTSDISSTEDISQDDSHLLTHVASGNVKVKGFEALLAQVLVVDGEEATGQNGADKLNNVIGQLQEPVAAVIRMKNVFQLFKITSATLAEELADFVEKNPQSGLEGPIMDNLIDFVESKGEEKVLNLVILFELSSSTIAVDYNGTVQVFQANRT